MGIDATTSAAAFAKAHDRGRQRPSRATGKVFISGARRGQALHPCRTWSRLAQPGPRPMVATSGTARDDPATRASRWKRVKKIHEGRPHVLDLIKSISEVRLIINTPSGRRERSDDRLIRSAAASHRIPCITTLAAASATIQGMENWMKQPLAVAPLQEHPQRLRGARRRSGPGRNRAAGRPGSRRQRLSP